MDLKLPDVEEFEIIKQIRQYNKEIPVIAHTSYVHSKNKDIILQASVKTTSEYEQDKL